MPGAHALRNLRSRTVVAAADQASPRKRRSYSLRSAAAQKKKITDAPSVQLLPSQLHPHTVEGIDRIRAVTVAPGPPADLMRPSLRQISSPTTISGGYFSPHPGVQFHQRDHQSE